MYARSSLSRTTLDRPAFLGGVRFFWLQPRASIRLIGVLGCSVLLFLLAGCQEGARVDGPSVSSASTSTSTATGAAAPTASATALPDVASYCTQMCRRAAECGLEQAQDLANELPGLQRAVQKERAAQADVVEECEATCATDTPKSAAERAIFDEASACSKAPDCKSFTACLNAVQ